MDRRRIGIFLLLTFAIAWATGLAIYLTGGLVDSPVLVAPLNLTLATLLLAGVYMLAPALAHVLTRLITREGWHELGLRPYFRSGWQLWAMAWVLPALLTIAGAGLFYLIFPQYFDPELGQLQALIAAQMARLGGDAQTLPMPPLLLAGVQTLQAILIAPLINGLFVFGEEFGWRAYLQPKLMVLGWRPAMLWMGLIWGVWHWPVIWMGYEYGFDYPGFPWAGPLIFLWFTFIVGVLLGWLTIQGRSVWPAVIGHAALNGIAPLPALFVQGEPNPLLGPLPIGLIGSLGFGLLALWLFWRTPDSVMAHSA